MLSAQKDAQRRYTKDKGISCALRCLREVDFHQNRSFKFPCTCCGRRCALKAKDKWKQFVNLKNNLISLFYDFLNKSVVNSPFSSVQRRLFYILLEDNKKIELKACKADANHRVFAFSGAIQRTLIKCCVKLRGKTPFLLFAVKAIRKLNSRVGLWTGKFVVYTGAF